MRPSSSSSGGSLISLSVSFLCSSRILLESDLSFLSTFFLIINNCFNSSIGSSHLYIFLILSSLLFFLLISETCKYLNAYNKAKAKIKIKAKICPKFHLQIFLKIHFITLILGSIYFFLNFLSTSFGEKVTF